MFNTKSRKNSDESVAPAPQAESIEAIRRRARHRLIGATVLVLIGVVAFPLLFDTQPRPIAVDIPIEIPDRNKVKPLPMPPAAAPAAAGKVAQAPATSSVTAAQPKAVASAAAATEPAAKPAEKPPAIAKAEPAPKSEEIIESKPKAEAKAESKPEAKPATAAKTDDGARARALLDGQRIAAASDTAQAEGRFVVQVGAFADAAKAREARLKVERAGLKTYTHVAETKEGTRIRVRAGPFGSRAEADRAAEKIKGLDLPAAILTL
jgi:DedD protein